MKKNLFLLIGLLSFFGVFAQNPPPSNGGESIGYNQFLTPSQNVSTIVSLAANSGQDHEYTFYRKRFINGSWESSWSSAYSGSSKSYTPTNSVYSEIYYRKHQFWSNGVKYLYSNYVVILRNVAVNGGSIGSNQTICPNTTPSLLTSVSTPSHPFQNLVSTTFTYAWFYSTDNVNWVKIENSNSLSYAPSSLSTTTYFKRVAYFEVFSGESNTVKIEVYGSPSTPIVSDNQTICYQSLPSDISIVTLPTGGAGSFSYQWQISNDGNGYTNIQNAIFQTYKPEILSSSKYYRVKATDACGSSVFSSPLYVNVLPDISAGTIGYENTVCYGSTPSALVSVVNPTGGDGSFSYQWQFLSGANWEDISDSNSPNYTPSAVYSTKIFRRLVKSFNCSYKPSNILTISVLSEFSAGSIGNNQTISFGASPSQLTNVSLPSGGSGSYSYRWQISSDNVSYNDIPNSNTEYYQPSSLFETKYFRRIVFDASCGLKYSNVVTITVLNSLNGGSILDNQTICYDTKPAKLTGTPASGGVGTFAYQWQKSTNNSTYADVVGATEQDYQPINLTQSTYFKRLATLGGQTVESNKVFIEVRPALSEPNTDLKGRYCKNSTATVTVTDVETGIKYNWYSSSNALLSVGSQFSISNFAEETSLFVQKEDVQGCLSTKKSLTLRVDNVFAQFSADKASIKQGEKVTFTNSSVGGNSYSWNFGDGVVSPEFSPVHYFHKVNGNQPTAYSVSLVVTSQFGCTSSEVKNDLVVVNPLTSDVGDNSASSFRVFPSPVSEWLNVACEDGVSSLEVFSIGGELVGRFVGSDKLLTVNLSHLSNGVYIAKAYSQKGYVFVAKFIKQ